MAENIYMGYVFMAVCRAGGFNTNDFKEVIVDFMNDKFINILVSNLDFNKTKDIKKYISIRR